MKFYPLQFEPIFKERIWGGEKLKTILNKPITSNITGESWELSAVEGDVSIVSNGEWKGKSLTALMDEWPNEIWPWADFTQDRQPDRARPAVRPWQRPQAPRTNTAPTC